jgi:hypothetical protein
MNAGAMYIATSYFIGNLLGLAFVHFRKPIAAAALYFAGKHHDLLSENGGKVVNYFLGTMGF